MKTTKRCLCRFLLLIIIVIAFFCGMLLSRGHMLTGVTTVEFKESARELKNPNCGFYYMHGFYITDENMDFRYEIAKRFCADEATALTMIQINLANYREGAISAKGLENIQNLFETLRTVDKQLIVRFLYDWDGDCRGKEPEQLDIILQHMTQVGPIVAAYSDQILTTQGLFIGNWGEMNGTVYTGTEDIRTLANTFFEATQGRVYMAVRMPMFVRRATAYLNADTREEITLRQRLGLYNDGMLASFSDYGTYGQTKRELSGDLEPWTREEELAYQESLCCTVPQGGEVIIDNEYNDIENAIRDLKKMHVTYLNRDFDQKVYKKWQNQTVSEGGCFQGMDGLSYMERHIGYRLLLRQTTADYRFWTDELTASVELQNVGFAPVYHACRGAFLLVNPQNGEKHIYSVEVPIFILSGGNASEQTLNVEEKIKLNGLCGASYEIYFALWDENSGQMIAFANEQDMTEYGYLLGEISMLQEGK